MPARATLLAGLVLAAALGIRFHALFGEDLSQVALVAERGGYQAHPNGLPAADLRFVIWLVARNARTLLTQPGQLMAAELCHPAESALALGEPGVTLGLLGAPAWALCGDPLLAFHTALLGSIWLAGFAMFWLVRAWTGSAVAGVAAGLLFAFHPARIADVIHPYIWDNAWLVFGLFFAERLFANGRWRDALMLAVCCVLQLGGSLYPLAGGLALALPLLVWLLWRHGLKALRPGPVLLVVVLVGVAAVALFTPYLELREAGMLEPRFKRYLAWSQLLPGEAFFPGFLLLLLVAAGLLLRPRDKAPDPRWALLVGALLAAYLAAGGTAGENLLAIARGGSFVVILPNLYAALAAVVPGLDVVRAPANLYTATHLALCVLAGFGAAALLRLAPVRYATAAAALLLALAALAALRPPLPGVQPAPRLVAVRVAPDPAEVDFYADLADAGNDGPIVELPYDPRDMRRTSTAVLLSAYHRRRTAACWGSRRPDHVAEIQNLAGQLPKAAGVEGLAEMGFTTVVRRQPVGLPRAAWWHPRQVEALSDGTLRRLAASGELRAYRIADGAEPRVPASN